MVWGNIDGNHSGVPRVTRRTSRARNRVKDIDQPVCTEDMTKAGTRKFVQVTHIARHLSGGTGVDDSKDPTKFNHIGVQRRLEGRFKLLDGLEKRLTR